MTVRGNFNFVSLAISEYNNDFHGMVLTFSEVNNGNTSVSRRQC